MQINFQSMSEEKRVSNVMTKRQAAIRNKADEIYEELETYSRKPFMEMLSQAVSACPTPKDLLALSKKSPDRYGQYLSILARLAGFTDQTMVQLGLVQMLPTLPEAE